MFKKCVCGRGSIGAGILRQPVQANASAGEAGGTKLDVGCAETPADIRYPLIERLDGTQLINLVAEGRGPVGQGGQWQDGQSAGKCEERP